MARWVCKKDRSRPHFPERAVCRTHHKPWDPIPQQILLHLMQRATHMLSGATEPRPQFLKHPLCKKTRRMLKDPIPHPCLLRPS